MRRGFKAEANWYAREMRRELNLMAHDPLCPRVLAAHLGYNVVGLSDFSSVQPLAVSYLRSQVGQREFSAITVCDSGVRLIVHNDAHSPRRQAANISHELAHGLLVHPPAPLTGAAGGRVYNREHEEEANWLGPALLVSEEAALLIAEHGQPFDPWAVQYGVSLDLLLMRLRVTGALIRVGRRRAA